jgi:hypothetical protein
VRYQNNGSQITRLDIKWEVRENESMRNGDAETMSTSFRQTAQGRFDFRVRPNTPHCGPSTAQYPAKMQANYEVEITYGKNALDKRGFLLDNTWFGEYFQGFSESQIGISCECLCQLVADDIVGQLRREGRPAVKVSVCIEAIPGVKVHCEVCPELPVRSLIGETVKSLQRTPGSLYL